HPRPVPRSAGAGGARAVRRRRVRSAARGGGGTGAGACGEQGQDRGERVVRPAHLRTGCIDPRCGGLSAGERDAGRPVRVLAAGRGGGGVSEVSAVLTDGPLTQLRYGPSGPSCATLSHKGRGKGPDFDVAALWPSPLVGEGGEAG